MKWLGRTRNLSVINLFIFGHGVVIYYSMTPTYRLNRELYIHVHVRALYSSVVINMTTDHKCIQNIKV